MSTLQELLARISEAQEGSYDLDAAIAKDVAGWTYDRRGNERRDWWRKPGEEWFFRHDYPPRFSRSLDAALSLVEAKLPGSHWRVEKTCERPALAFRTHQFTGYCGNWGTPSRAEGPTPALALLAAMLKALIAQDAQKENSNG